MAALRAAATFLHNPRIRSNGISSVGERGMGRKPPRLLQPAFSASRHALSREESLGPRFLVLDSHFSYHFAFAIILHAKFRHRIFEIRSVPGWKSGGSSRRRSMHSSIFEFVIFKMVNLKINNKEEGNVSRDTGLIKTFGP